MGGEGLLELVNDRKEMLSYLADNPAQKRDIIEELDVSRSTVDRAVSRLTENQLIARSHNGYKTTNKGETALSAVNCALNSLENIDEASQFFQYLPEQSSIPHYIFEEADIRKASELSGRTLLDDELELLEECNSLRMVSYADTHPKFNEVLIERLFGDELDFKVVFREDLAKHIFDKYDQYAKEFVQSDHIKSQYSDDIGFGLIIFYLEKEIICHMDVFGVGNAYIGTIGGDSTRLIDWAENFFQDAWDSGHDISDIV